MKSINEVDMDIIEKYKLNKNVTEKILSKNGFDKSGTYKCFVYKNIIQLIVRVDIEEKWWDYLVYNIDTKSIYNQFYDRKYGKNEMVKEIDHKVKKIINELVKSNILYKQEKKDNGKKSGKI